MIRKWYNENLTSETPISKIEFSKPRKYKDLKNRIGIVTCVPSSDLDICFSDKIFIFKKRENVWEIERVEDVITKFEHDERRIAQDLLYRERLGIEDIKLRIEEEKEIHSMIEEEYKTKIIEEYKKILPHLPKNLKVLEVKFFPPRKYRDLENRNNILYLSN